MKKPRSCNQCKYAIMQDFGYSNYTVEGTTFYCFLKKHPISLLTDFMETTND